MKKLLLHTCCAPCLTSVHGILKCEYRITAYWFNPNIEPLSESNLRLNTFKNFCDTNKIEYFIEESEQGERWKDFVQSNVNDTKEGGVRCNKCIEFRLKQSAKFAKENEFDLFATTLSVSPHKNASIINNIGNDLSNSSQINFLEANFKKNNGYLRSIELSKQFGLYRQNYCGCLQNKITKV